MLSVSKFSILQIVLFAIGLISWIVAIDWVFDDFTQESVLAFLAGTAAFIGSYLVKGDFFNTQSSLFYDLSSLHNKRNRQIALQNVKTVWIDGFYNNSLQDIPRIEITLEQKPETLLRFHSGNFQETSYLDRASLFETRVFDIFNKRGKALLILGKPGSGKTIALLELTRDLIAQAELDETKPLPLVFNLASWSNTRSSLADWLIDELNLQYQVSKNVGKAWIENDQVTLLLDGLDEVNSEYRDACVRAINQFRGVHMVGIAVCSRLKDYEKLKIQLNFSYTIYLKPLTLEQINQYLSNKELEFRAVRYTLQHDSDLQQLASSPLMLNIMTLAYRGLSNVDLQSLASPDDRRQHLFSAYIQRMLTRRPIRKGYSQQQVIDWLSWLALRMSEQSLSIFYVERLQPTWLPTSNLRHSYTILSGLIIGLVAGVGAGVGIGVGIGLGFGALYGMFFGALTGLVIGASGFWWQIDIARKGTTIIPEEKLTLSWPGTLKFVILMTLSLIPGFLLGGSIGFFLGLDVGLFFGLSLGIILIVANGNIIAKN